MKLPLQTFSSACAVIDFAHPAVARKAREIKVAAATAEPCAIARQCFLFVRDEIAHSGDARSEVVTLKASEVLQARTGWCFAKSHLLAALLRANGIPAALCYQRLRWDEHDPEQGFTLHGFNAVWLPEHGWYRCDPRGNKPGVHADFMPPVEQLAWRVQHEGEMDFPGLYASPVAAVIASLTSSDNFHSAVENLPDAVVL